MEPVKLLNEAVNIVSLAVEVKKNIRVDIKASQEHRDIYAHRLEYRHREKLLEAGQEHNVAQIVHLVHVLTVDYSEQLHICRRIITDLLYLAVAVGDLAERKSSSPYELNVRHALSNLDEIENSLAHLELTRADNCEFVLIYSVFLAQLYLLLRGNRVEHLRRNEVRDIRNLRFVNAVVRQPADEIRIYRHKIIHALVEADHVLIEYLLHEAREIHARLHRFRQHVDITYRLSPASE